MSAAGIKLTQHAYNHFVSLYAATGDIRHMEMKVEEMQKLGHARTALTYRAMIAGYSKAGLVAKTVETFNAMRNAGYKPSVKVGD